VVEKISEADATGVTEALAEGEQCGAELAIGPCLSGGRRSFVSVVISSTGRVQIVRMGVETVFDWTYCVIRYLNENTNSKNSKIHSK